MRIITTQCTVTFILQSAKAREGLEPSAQEGHGTVGAGPKEGYKNDPRAGAPLL